MAEGKKAAKKSDASKKKPQGKKAEEARVPTSNQAQTSDQAQTSTSNYVSTSNQQVNLIQRTHPKGITLSLYGTTDDESDDRGVFGYKTKEKIDAKTNQPLIDEKDKNNNAEFGKAAQAGAMASNSVIASLDMGYAIKANSQASAILSIKEVYESLHKAYADDEGKPAGAPPNPEHLKIKNLSLYYHGSKDALIFPREDTPSQKDRDKRGELEKARVSNFISEIRTCLKNDVHVQLYACNTAANSGTKDENKKIVEDGFAHAMAKAIGGSSRVYGHSTPGHTTENANARYFRGNGTAVEMFDELMPEAWIKQEAERIWGKKDEKKLTEKQKKEEQDKLELLKEELRKYYEYVCGLKVEEDWKPIKKNGETIMIDNKGNKRTEWDADRRRQFEQHNTRTRQLDDRSAVTERNYPKAYVNGHQSAMGRHMFYDSEDAAKLLQDGWKDWARTNLKQKERLQKFKLAPTFDPESAQENAGS